MDYLISLNAIEVVTTFDVTIQNLDGSEYKVRMDQSDNKVSVLKVSLKSNPFDSNTDCNIFL